MSVADVIKVFVNALADVDDADLRADLLGDDDGVGLRAGGCAEAGQGARNDIRRGQTHALDRLCADHNGER